MAKKNRSRFNRIEPVLFALASSFLASHGAFGDSSDAKVGSSVVDRLSEHLGVTYFTFIDGPGTGQPLRFSPNSMGRRSDTGLSAWTNLSARLKFSKNLALDYQFRLQQILTNDLAFRFQGGRLGLSGKLLDLETTSLKAVWTGAVNSDLPNVGQVNSERKLVFNPGLFTQLSIKPKNSRFSLFAMVTPRLWFYSDPDAMALQDLDGGLNAGQKPQYTLNLQPSINYALSEKAGLRLGLTLDVRKNVSDEGLRRWFWPVDLGYTHEFGPGLSIYPHIRFSGPWDDGLRGQLSTTPAAWTSTFSLGLWLSGTIL